MNAACDLREGGRWSPAQRVKNGVLFALATVVLAIAERLPRRVLVGTGRVLGELARLLVPSARRIAERNVAQAFPDLTETAQRAIVRRAFRNLGEHLGEVVSMLDPNEPLAPLAFAPGARELLDEAAQEGRGIVFASAHLGPWERVAATLIAAGVPMTVIAREPYDPRLRPIYERLRGGRGVRVVWRGAAGAATALLRTLRRGEVLGIPMDLASRVPSVDAPFLGTRAPTPVGPARLALRTGAAVVVGTAGPAVGGGLVVQITRIPTGDLPNGEAGERELTTRINDELSARIRALPDRWVWLHPRWPSL
jgi:Kdo2-lipid IVA lauroyltransferase/acyltransferase